MGCFGSGKGGWGHSRSLLLTPWRGALHAQGLEGHRGISARGVGGVELVREFSQMFGAVRDVPRGRGQDFFLPSPQPGAQVSKQTRFSRSPRHPWDLFSKSGVCLHPQFTRRCRISLPFATLSPPPHTPSVSGSKSPTPGGWLRHDLIHGTTGKEGVAWGTGAEEGGGPGKLEEGRRNCTTHPGPASP